MQQLVKMDFLAFSRKQIAELWPGTLKFSLLRAYGEGIEPGTEKCRRYTKQSNMSWEFQFRRQYRKQTCTCEASSELGDYK